MEVAPYAANPAWAVQGIGVVHLPGLLQMEAAACQESHSAEARPMKAAATQKRAPHKNM